MYKKENFENPDHSRAPLQIVHDFEFVALNLKSDLYLAALEGDDQKRREHIKFRLDRLKKRGYAGVVMSVDNLDYLEDEEALERMAWAIDYAYSLGMRVWIYDEQYYPTGAAGGLTLRNHPEHEGMALCCVERRVEVKLYFGPVRIMSPYGHSALKYAFAENERGERLDVGRYQDPAGNLCWDAPVGKWRIWCFFLRPMYEGSSAPVALRAARRYPDVSDAAAMKRFLEVTYGPYERVLGERLKDKVEAIFTDEPNRSPYYEYPEDRDPRVRQSVYPSESIYDIPDLEIPIYPFFPWSRELEETFEKRCGYALASKLPELFGEDLAGTQQLRRDFCDTMAEMFCHAYNEQFQEKFAEHGLKYTGHHIYEETISIQPFAYGDLLHVLSAMDIPGCDLLHSAPDQTRHAIACKIASSAAHQYGKSHVMIEASNMCDRDQTFSVERLELAMAMLYALGVDTITSYYGEELFDEDGYRRFTDYTARLGALVEGGCHESQVLVYYPYEQMAALTVAARIRTPEEATEIEQAIWRISEELLSGQVDYDFVNQELLVKYECAGGEILTDCGERPRAIIFPPVSFVDDPVAAWIEKAIAAGVRVIFDGMPRTIRGLENTVGLEFAAECGLPVSWDLQLEDEPLLTCFHRHSESQEMYLLVNTGEEKIEREASVPLTGGKLLLLDLETGRETGLSCRADGGRVYFSLNLSGGQALALVQE